MAVDAMRMAGRVALDGVSWAIAGAAGVLVGLELAPIGPHEAVRQGALGVVGMFGVPTAWLAGLAGLACGLLAIEAPAERRGLAWLSAFGFGLIGFGVLSAPLALGAGPSLMAELVMGGHSWLSAILLLATVAALVFLAPTAGGDPALGRFVRALLVFVTAAFVVAALLVLVPAM